MKALPGMTLAKTRQLLEIKHYTETGSLPDGSHITDAWVDSAMRFLVEELLPLLEAFEEIRVLNDHYTLVSIEAGKVCRAWRRASKHGAVPSEGREDLHNALKALDAVVKPPR